MSVERIQLLFGSGTERCYLNDTPKAGRLKHGAIHGRGRRELPECGIHSAYDDRLFENAKGRKSENAKGKGTERG
jgi:hypothetical protein